MENLTRLLAEVKDRPLEISETKTGEIIKTSQRNQLRTDIMTALLADIRNEYKYVYRGEEGILLDVANDSVADNLKSEEGSGGITVLIDIKIKGLNTNAEAEAEDYANIVAEKAAKKEAQAKAKAEKIAKDKAEREEKAKAKQKD